MLNKRYYRKLCDSVLAKSTHLFFLINTRENQLEEVYGWIAKNKNTKKKRENTIYLWSAVYQQTNEQEIYLHAADVNYHHDCWLGVTIKDIPAALEKL